MPLPGIIGVELFTGGSLKQWQLPTITRNRTTKGQFTMALKYLNHTVDEEHLTYSSSAFGRSIHALVAATLYREHRWRACQIDIPPAQANQLSQT